MTLAEIAAQTKTCQKCSLHETRIKTVPGEGSSQAQIFFCGEAPGKDEDLQGLPFIGQAGKLLTELIESIGLKREDVFIGNVIKCRPPNNRDPLPEEVSTCWPYLEAQIKAIKPKLIVLLGRHAMDRFLPNLKISQVHGQAKRYKGIWSKTQVYLPLYHPAAALYTRSLKEILLHDFQKIPILLQKIDHPKPQTKTLASNL